MEFQRVGSDRFISVDVRVIAATNRNLPRLVKEGLFREDLWFRLNVFPIWIPPLRQRKEDIRELAEHFALTKTSEMNLPRQPGFAPGALEQLAAYDWPGNVRELQNVIERELIVSNGRPLSFPLLGSPVQTHAADESSEQAAQLLTMDETVTRHIREGLNHAGGRINGPGGAAQLLGMNPSTLRSKMKKLGIRVERVTA
jgi:transcriptional regulator with GAF, ATPase, and Fis domain